MKPAAPKVKSPAGAKKRAKQRAGKAVDLDAEPVEIDPNFLVKKIIDSDIDALVDAMTYEDNPHYPVVTQKMTTPDEFCKSPLDFASILGRTEIALAFINTAIERDDFNINKTSSAGYISLHHAAAWGRLEIVKRLVESGADMQQRNKNDERPREVAARYCQQSCVDYLDWAEARKFLLDSIGNMQAVIADKERVVLLTKEERLYATAAAKEKNDWFNNTPDADTVSYRIQRRDLDDSLKPIWAKLEAAAEAAAAATT